MNNTLKLNSNNVEILKWLATTFMFIDHVGLFLLNNNQIFRNLGRISYPIFAFLIIYNYLNNTSNQKKMIIRLFVFAIISQFFYFLFFSFEFNIIFQFATSLLIIYNIEYIYKIYKLKNNKIVFLIQLLILLLILYIIYPIFNYYSYSYDGLFLLLSFYLYLNYSKNYFILVLIFLFFLNNTIPDKITTLMVFIIILTIGQINFKFKLKRLNKYFFYWIYPLQFLIFKILLII